MNEDTAKIAKLLGKRGGLKTKRIYGKKHFSRMGKLGSQIRWGKKKEKRNEK